MDDRPAAIELIAAARYFLETELIPTLADQRLKFQTLIVANVLAIVERELQTEEKELWAEWRWLAEMLQLEAIASSGVEALREHVRQANERLCDRIRTGAYDEAAIFLSLLGQVRRQVEKKLEVANPRYLAGFRG